MRPATLSLLCGICLVFFAAAQAHSADDAAAQEICRRLENQAKINFKDMGFDKDAAYDSLIVKPSMENDGVYTFEMQVKDNDQKRLNLCHLAAGQALGVLLEKGEKVEGLVIMRTPDKMFAGTLPVSVCRDMGKQLLAEPRNMDELLNSIVMFVAKAELFEAKPKN